MDEPGRGEAPGHVIHLRVTVPTLDAATELAALLTESLAFLPELDAGEVTVSAEDAQHERHRVFCDRLLAGGGRCGEREGHAGPCTAGRDGGAASPRPRPSRCGPGPTRHCGHGCSPRPTAHTRLPARGDIPVPGEVDVRGGSGPRGMASALSGVAPGRGPRAPGPGRVAAAGRSRYRPVR